MFVRYLKLRLPPFDMQDLYFYASILLILQLLLLTSRVLFYHFVSAVDSCEPCTLALMSFTSAFVGPLFVSIRLQPFNSLNTLHP